MVLIVTILTIVIWTRILNRFDDARRLKSRRTAVRGFFLYGLLSIPLVLVLYRVAGSLMFPIIRHSLILEEILLVGPVEEGAKFFIFYLVAARKASIQEPKDGILHAASVGLAFSVVENIIYSAYGFETMMQRAVLCTAGHMSYAAIWGYAAGVYLYTYKTDGEDYPFSMVLIALAVAAMLHGLYNSFLDIDLTAAAVLLDLGTVTLAILSLSYLKKVSPFTEIPFDRCRQAIPELRDAISNNPDNFVLRKRIALHYIRAGEYSSALAHLKKAAALSPRELSSRFYIALLEYADDTGSADGSRRAEPKAAVTAEASISATAPSRERLYRLMRKMPLKSFVRIKKQAAEVFAGHPRSEEINDLCAELLACKRSFMLSTPTRVSTGENHSRPAARITAR
ncbi:MAG: PrsW family intramembrane metalloprotease [Spirochaetota bacterium]|nr:PrsW family intramembrane metalloprotease [Spirochaetota bacterium]